MFLTRLHPGVTPRILSIVSLALAAAFLISACGDSGTSQEELDRARQQGAAQARQQLKIQQIQQQLRALKRGSTDSASAASGSTSTDISPCGGNLYVGANTTCSFAANVQSDYFSQIGVGSGTVHSYSPTTERVYTMSCTAGTPHVCTGGNNASVYFP